LLSRIHIYCGLLTLANLVLYGIVGISSLLDTRAAARPQVWEQAFAIDQTASDRMVAERVAGLLGLSLAMPVHDFNFRRDAQHRLALDFYHANGRHKITVLENPPRLHIEHTRAGLWKYLSTLHVTTAAFHSGDWRMQLWAWWNEFAMWCLLVMLASGVWIWLERRPGSGTWRRVHRWSALGLVAVLAVYEVSAIHMAHRTWWKAGAWLDRIHRMRPVSFAPVLGAGLLVLGASGVVLWWGLRRERRAGAVLLAAGITVACMLIVWMRMG
jgi:uncharacterized iron-regulated membrane protein